MISGNSEQALVPPGSPSSGGGMAKSKSKSKMGIEGKVEPAALAAPKSPSVSDKPSGGNYSPPWAKGGG